MAYKQGSTTELPPEVSTHFSGVRDAADDLKTIQPLVPSGKLLDYGCSWGYCTRQFIEAGYDAEGFEISEPRAQYGRGTLGLRITSDITDFEDSSFDVIYTAHVLEHIPTPKATLNEFRRLLKPGGMLFLYVPNCGGKRARDQGVHWGPMMGEKHVLSLTAEFFLRNLPAHGFDVSQPTDPDGDELRVIARRGTE
ncbi:MAG TPA: class I SAM-dependent methyltransferase [Silvibacterium sp.]|nr:class I SAM-dependent methyltransferase [Silvibacterium sp.]